MSVRRRNFIIGSTSLLATGLVVETAQATVATDSVGQVNGVNYMVATTPLGGPPPKLLEDFLNGQLENFPTQPPDSVSDIHGMVQSDGSHNHIWLFFKPGSGAEPKKKYDLSHVIWAGPESFLENDGNELNYQEARVIGYGAGRVRRTGTVYLVRSDVIAAQPAASHSTTVD